MISLSKSELFMDKFNTFSSYYLFNIIFFIMGIEAVNLQKKDHMTIF